MQEPIGNVGSDFIRLKSRDVLKQLLKRDEGNYGAARSKLNQHMRVLDDAVALFITRLQEAYRSADAWRANAPVQLSIAMAASTLNCVLLTRHGILLGYYPEVRDLFRGCFERVTRCVLFHMDGDEAHRFLAGVAIQQSHVDDRLTPLLSRVDAGETGAARDFRGLYRFLHDVVQSSLGTTELGTGDSGLARLVGRPEMESLFGGVLSAENGKAHIAVLTLIVLFALSALRIVLGEGPSDWVAELDRVKAECSGLLE